ncbi:MAG: 3-dehydroquinate synthase, partial [Lentisphaerae bacterium]|nr:3-dehydroquinate synthase [Lentisphaerota bacterium]
AAVLTDATFARAQGGALRAMFGDAPGLAVEPGEGSKSIAGLGRVLNFLAEQKLDRGGALFAVGGGVIGDLGGFAAASYLRGIDFFQVPTTLLAMVDSSVGGKTGVNLKAGKNLVGAFYQPIEVVADLSTLKTLTDREYLSGLAEVVKYGVIWDAALFRKLEEQVAALRRRDLDMLEPIVARCCEIKAEVVAVDERDSGVRAILNFGHTLGHALELVADYNRWLHGEAVSMGMVYAAELSHREKGFPAEDCRRLSRLLEALGLPIRPGANGFGGDWAALRAAMSTDKKAQLSVPRFVLAQKLGSVVYDHEVDEATLAAAFETVFGAV